MLCTLKKITMAIPTVSYVRDSVGDMDVVDHV